MVKLRKHLYHANNPVHNKTNQRQCFNEKIVNYNLQETVQANITTNVKQFNGHAHHTVNFLILNCYEFVPLSYGTLFVTKIASLFSTEISLFRKEIRNLIL